ncbi:mitochondrial amidoxime reducing component 2-like [Diadema antillarum]|uniref:mitochondrial amidoxime reducing component 2-like n=1 Tax=Diadema antillarum TaxID=105358 RepID=UPI003A88A24F
MSDFLNNKMVVGGLAACAVGVLGIGLFYTLRQKSRKYMPVGVVSCIYVHPIKSCRGLEVSEAECAALGIRTDGVTDRSFLIVSESGTFITQRQHPSIALIYPSVSEDKKALVINAPGMPTIRVSLVNKLGSIVDVRVWKLDLKGEDCGDEVGQWLDQYLGTTGYRLLRHQDKLGGKLIQNDPKWGIKAKRNEKAVYQDCAQINILGMASLTDLNSRLEKPVDMRNFRPNIVVEGTSAFTEDEWKYVRIGKGVQLRTTHMCARCRQTTVNQDTGKFMENGDPLTTLKEFRMPSSEDPDKHRYGPSPLFGTNLAVELPGRIKLGDVVYASMD